MLFTAARLCRSVFPLPTTAQEWQHPFVNVFKFCCVEQQEQQKRDAEISGKVAARMDDAIHKRVLRITGAIPAVNYLKLPKSRGFSLHGRFCYLQVRCVCASCKCTGRSAAAGLLVAHQRLQQQQQHPALTQQLPYSMSITNGSSSQHGLPVMQNLGAALQYRCQPPSAGTRTCE
jgi:hypothetical protein